MNDSGKKDHAHYLLFYVAFRRCGNFLLAGSQLSAGLTCGKAASGWKGILTHDTSISMLWAKGLYGLYWLTNDLNKSSKKRSLASVMNFKYLPFFQVRVVCCCFTNKLPKNTNKRMGRCRTYFSAGLKNILPSSFCFPRVFDLGFWYYFVKKLWCGIFFSMVKPSLIIRWRIGCTCQVYVEL